MNRGTEHTGDSFINSQIRFDRVDGHAGSTGEVVFKLEDIVRQTLAIVEQEFPDRKTDAEECLRQWADYIEEGPEKLQEKFATALNDVASAEKVVERAKSGSDNAKRVAAGKLDTAQGELELAQLAIPPEELPKEGGVKVEPRADTLERILETTVNKLKITAKLTAEEIKKVDVNKLIQDAEIDMTTIGVSKDLIEKADTRLSQWADYIEEGPEKLQEKFATALNDVASAEKVVERAKSGSDNAKRVATGKLDTAQGELELAQLAIPPEELPGTAKTAEPKTDTFEGVMARAVKQLKEIAQTKRGIVRVAAAPVATVVVEPAKVITTRAGTEVGPKTVTREAISDIVNTINKDLAKYENEGGRKKLLDLLTSGNPALWGDENQYIEVYTAYLRIGGAALTYEQINAPASRDRNVIEKVLKAGPELIKKERKQSAGVSTPDYSQVKAWLKDQKDDTPANLEAIAKALARFNDGSQIEEDFEILRIIDFRNLPDKALTAKIVGMLSKRARQPVVAEKPAEKPAEASPEKEEELVREKGKPWYRSAVDSAKSLFGGAKKPEVMVGEKVVETPTPILEAVAPVEVETVYTLPVAGMPEREPKQLLGEIATDLQNRGETILLAGDIKVLMARMVRPGLMGFNPALREVEQLQPGATVDITDKRFIQVEGDLPPRADYKKRHVAMIYTFANDSLNVNYEIETDRSQESGPAISIKFTPGLKALVTREVNADISGMRLVYEYEDFEGTRLLKIKKI